MNKKLSNLKLRIRARLIKVLLRVKPFRSSENIVIFSEGRGGSTWLMEILAKATGACINWEPLHPVRGVVPAAYQFGNIPYIPEDNKDSNYKRLFSKIHRYKLHTTWTRSYLSLYSLFKTKHVLVKYIRANLLVPYLLNNFDFKYAPIFLIRHPIDTCLSQMKAFSEDTDFSLDSLNNERFERHKDYLSQLESNLERKIALWCLNNCSTIEQLDELNLHVVFYVDLLLRPKEELRKILLTYGLNQYEDRISEIDYRKASFSDFDADYQKEVDQQLHKNLNKISEQTKDSVQAIFDYFGFKLFNAYSPYPDKALLKPEEVS